MAKKQSLRSGATVGAVDSFTITQPASEESVALHTGNTITVEVDDTGDHDDFLAAIYDVCTGAANAPPSSACTPLANVGGNTWRGEINVGYLDPFDLLEAMKNVIVYGVLGTDEFAKVQTFRVNRGGSACTPCSTGCSGSGSERQCTFCSAQPVPVCLVVRNSTATIQNDTACTACAALNADFLMQHSNDPCFSCCWFSGPVDFCNDGSMGYWKLQKKDARLWELGVWRSDSGTVSFPIVLYRFTTSADNVCTFPVTLTLDQESVDDACRNWPATITVEAAP